MTEARIIQLTKGYQVVVDAADYEHLSQWKWHACVGSKHVYAMRNSRPDDNGKRRHIMMHSELCPVEPGFFVDHINGNGLDNRRENLRAVTKTQNMWNRARNAGVRHKGVYWHKQHRKWVATIQVNKRRIHIGLFHDENEAAAAYAARAALEFGEFNREAP